MLLDQIATRSDVYSEFLRIVRRIATAETSILITGETGSGKDFVAEVIHDASPRRAFPFLKIDCASIPSSLAESEFFGYEKGAFSDAVSAKPGKLQLAEGGTVYLDGINHLSATVQSKLLRFAQERTLDPLGGTRSVTVNCRLITSVSAPLQQCLREKQLREDLYYRLAAVTIEVPPLRSRLQDLDLLLESLLREFNEKYHRTVAFTGEAIVVLRQYHWPGNIRELRNVVEHAVIHCESRVEAADLALNYSSAAPEFLSHAISNNLSLEDMERIYILEVLNRCGGHLGKASDMLKINRKTLWMKRRKYGI